MAKAQSRDGVFQRKDASGWYVSYVDTRKRRRKQKIEAHTRTQALATLAAIKTKVEKERLLDVKTPVEITVTDLFSRFQQHQKIRLPPALSHGSVEFLKCFENTSH